MPPRIPGNAFSEKRTGMPGAGLFDEMEKNSLIAEKGFFVLSTAQSWDTSALRARRGGRLLSLRLKSNGLGMLEHAGDVSVKTSAVGRDCSEVKLERRLAGLSRRRQSRVGGMHYSGGLMLPALWGVK